MEIIAKAAEHFDLKHFIKEGEKERIFRNGTSPTRAVSTTPGHQVTHAEQLSVMQSSPHTLESLSLGPRGGD